MRQIEIAKVQLRKIAQQKLDLRTRLFEDLDGMLPPTMIDGLASSLDCRTWLVGHDYELDESVVAIEELPPGADDESAEGGEAAGAVLLSSGGLPRLLVRFLGRVPIAPHGGFAADVYREGPDGWERIAGLADWNPSQWDQLETLWEEE